jgi:hypothetical protein
MCDKSKQRQGDGDMVGVEVVELEVTTGSQRNPAGRFHPKLQPRDKKQRVGESSEGYASRLSITPARGRSHQGMRFPPRWETHIPSRYRGANTRASPCEASTGQKQR